MLRKIGLITIIIGILFVVFGFVSDVFIAQKALNNASLAYAFYKMGFVISIIGIMVMLFQRLYRRLIKKKK